MKKVLLVLLTVWFSFLVVACGEVSPRDTTPPVLTGVEDITIFVGEEFDPLDGVTAIDDTDGDITDQIVVTGTFNVDAVGSYFLRYAIEDAAGNRTEKTRYLFVVVNPDDIGDDMVSNGDFTFGMAFWTTTTGLEGGNATYTVVDGELQIEIHSVSGGMWEPRLENTGITFEQGQAYRVSFDARSVLPRSIHVQIGELLDGPPWFNNFKPGQTDIFDLTTDMETYSFEFIMGQETNENGAILFEKGTVGPDNYLTTIYLDNVSIVPIDDIEDTIPPVISGATDVSIPLGQPFDPLAGVSVMDNVDGEITLTLEHIVSDVNVDELGEYTVVYTVSDEAGNVATVTRIITVIEPDDSMQLPQYPGWRLFINDWDGSAADMTFEDNVMSVELTNINFWENWQLQIIQDAYAMGLGDVDEGSLYLEAGQTYRVTFDAMASVEGDVTLAIGHQVGGWHPYFVKDDITVTTTMETHEIIFTLDAEGDYSVPAQFKLEMAMLFSGLEAPQSFHLTNVQIDVLEDEAYVATDLIFNGHMAEAPTVYALEGWRAFVNDWEGSEAHIYGEDGMLVLDITAINFSQNWQLQVIQDAFALGTGEDNEGSIQFEAGRTYRVRFNTMASTVGEITLAIGHAGGGWTPYFVEEGILVGPEMTHHEIVFTLDAEGDYDVLGQFKLEMGMLFSDALAPQQFRLGHVTLEIEEDGEFVDAGLLVNGEMAPGEGVDPDPDPDPGIDEPQKPGWRVFVNDWEGSAAEATFEDNVMTVDITAINFWENWQLQVIQDAFALGTGADNEGSFLFETGATYRLRFYASASVEGEVTLAIGHGGGGWTPYHMEALEVDADLELYEIIFTLDDAEIDYSIPAQLKFEMGMLFAGEDAPQTFNLANVTLEVEVEGEFVDAELVFNGNMEPGEAVDPDPDPDPGNDEPQYPGWRVFVNDWEGSAAEATFADNLMTVNITAINFWENWQLQVIQDAFALGTGADNEGSFLFETGATYRLRFYASASVEGEITLAIGHGGGGWTPYHMETLEVDSDLEAYEVIFTLDDAEIDYSVPAQLKFEMGMLFAGEDAPQTFNLANVTLEVEVEGEFVDAELVFNGTMESGPAEE